MKIVQCIMLVILSLTSVVAQEWPTQLDNFLNNELPQFNIPNLEILVVNTDTVLYAKSIGESSPTSTYYIGSVSKSLTAYGILKLIEQKKLSFDTKVIDVIPEIQFSNSQEKISIWHLLTHTSGIKKKSGFNYLPTLEELTTQKFKIINESIDPLKHEYSNLNYALLGLIIEKTTNLSFKDYMHSYVFKPLRMENSKIGSKEELSTQLINHYQYFGLFPIKSEQLNFASSSIPAGFISSSASDLGNYLQLNLAGGKFDKVELIEATLLQSMHTVWDKGDFGYAMGWKQGKYNNYKFYQHLGSTANSYSGIFFIPDRRLGFVLLSNSNSIDFAESIAEGVLNILTEGEQKKASKFEFFLRIGVMLGYLWVIVDFLMKLVKSIKNSLSLTRKKAIINLSVCIALLIALIFIFPMVANIPFRSFLKIQPDIGFLILFSLILPVLSNLFKLFKAKRKLAK